jgi:hypothetical protein
MFKLVLWLVKGRNKMQNQCFMGCRIEVSELNNTCGWFYPLLLATLRNWTTVADSQSILVQVLTVVIWNFACGLRMIIVQEENARMCEWEWWLWIYSCMLFNNITTVFKYVYKFYSYPFLKTLYNMSVLLAVKFVEVTSPLITSHYCYWFQFVSFCRGSLNWSSLPI